MGKKNLDQERNRLNSLGDVGRYGSGINEMMVREFSKRALTFYKGGSVLELGPAEGIGTEVFLGAVDHLEVVEGSLSLSENLVQKFPSLQVHNSLFEEFESEERFELIIMSHVLEHVENPIEILSKFSKFLMPGGKVVIGVPNADSIHRQLAVNMGLLETTFSLGETDHLVGHRRVYSHEKLRHEVELSGLEINELTGFWLKPYSNAQLEPIMTQQLIDASMELGQKYFEIAAEIMCVARLRQG